MGQPTHCGTLTSTKEKTAHVRTWQGRITSAVNCYLHSRTRSNPAHSSTHDNRELGSLLYYIRHSPPRVTAYTSYDVTEYLISCPSTYLEPRRSMRSEGQLYTAHLKPLVLRMPSNAAACTVTSLPSTSTVRRHTSHECRDQGTRAQKFSSSVSMAFRKPAQYLTPCCSPTMSVTTVVCGADTSTSCPSGGNQCHGTLVPRRHVHGGKDRAG